MILDNLFSMVGGVGTAGMLMGIVAFVGFAPVSALVCPHSALKRMQPRGR